SRTTPLSPFSFHVSLSFFIHDPPPTQLYTLSLHDALPIYLLFALDNDPLLVELGVPPGSAAIRVQLPAPVAEPSDEYLAVDYGRSEEHTSELQSRFDLVCRLLLEKKKSNNTDLT